MVHPINVRTLFGESTEPGADRCAALLDRAPIGLMLVRSDGLLCHANAAARQALSDSSAGLVIDERWVRPVSRRADTAWTGSLQAAAGGATLVLSRHGVQVGMAPWNEPEPPGHVVCTLRPHDALRDTALRSYCGLHGLTRGETDVLFDLARGSNPKAIARKRGTSEGTVRSQVKSMLAKTGTHGLRELVAHALCCTPVPWSD
jgi:DNA-binding CsgD family transcriptional regulator